MPISLTYSSFPVVISGLELHEFPYAPTPSSTDLFAYSHTTGSTYSSMNFTWNDLINGVAGAYSVIPNNGLTNSGGFLELGGTLIQPTTINLSNTNSLLFQGINTGIFSATYSLQVGYGKGTYIQGLDNSGNFNESDFQPAQNLFQVGDSNGNLTGYNQIPTSITLNLGDSNGNLNEILMSGTSSTNIELSDITGNINKLTMTSTQSLLSSNYIYMSSTYSSFGPDSGTASILFGENPFSGGGFKGIIMQNADYNATLGVSNINIGTDNMTFGNYGTGVFGGPSGVFTISSQILTLYAYDTITASAVLAVSNPTASGDHYSILLIDTYLNTGAVYESDYSANFVPNSLVSKKYVDNKFSSGVSGTMTVGTYSLVFTNGLLTAF